MSIVEAHRQAITANCTIITGNNIVEGNHNTVYGDWNTVMGDNNTVYGNNNTYIGMHNSVTGNNNTALSGDAKAILISIPLVGTAGPCRFPDNCAVTNHHNETLDECEATNDPPQIPRTTPLELRAIRDNLLPPVDMPVDTNNNDPPQVSQQTFCRYMH